MAQQLKTFLRSETFKKLKFYFGQLIETIAYINLLLILIYSHQLGWRIFALTDLILLVGVTYLLVRDDKKAEDHDTKPLN